ncbi:threo-3-hydroxyaspartate ammonia-lyase [Verticillium alfalfae VaMs.102]|uniref:Threo-3-hydroxyaspartate ammonia-lyase n=1 Tax=Verticillium alfalfae (strain VaMs.102 / ATCC MYA-4576 / FGSC 10136) TaxID=526221 RepID=C9S5D3_VERA1|nr:threo-3-hydroxyaspartate ammonia-lyase [Verticillium alfalfae VaMs.102]EEY14205.1 threo-3-hydroxyaspartate ammonia-lyase [Verticillium alfalfae VaMs.102]
MSPRSPAQHGKAAHQPSPLFASISSARICSASVLSRPAARFMPLSASRWSLDGARAAAPSGACHTQFRKHAQALALAARESSIPAHIVMPSVSRPNKVAATKGYGAIVYPSGSTSVEREAVANEVIAATGARLVPPYDHPDIMLGQGTMGLEFQDQARDLLPAGKRDLDAIVTPCGGGGMLSGVALSCEGTGIRVYGSEPEYEGADDAKRGYEAGKRVETVKSRTIADGLRTPLGVHPWGVIYERKLVSAMFSVSEDDILQATKLVFERFKLVIEPSAAVPLATALYNEDFRAMVEREAGEAGWDLGLVFSGGNIAVDGLAELFAAKQQP